MDIVIGIDHGTTRTKALALDSDLRVVARGSATLRSSFPQPGWVEQDPFEILAVTQAAVHECLSRLPADARILGIGLANQGETILLWDRDTGSPVYPAIVWQDRRTSEFCERLGATGLAAKVRARTGLELDPYFSAPKARWILDHVPEARRLARMGRLLFGTTDTWIVWNWSGRELYVTDATTASRTALLDIDRLVWDGELITAFGLDALQFPRIARCDEIVGTLPLDSAGRRPLAGLIVDQQAALLSHACLDAGMAKATYGTGTFVLMQIGPTARRSSHGLLTTVAWSLDSGTRYALDGGVYTTGAVVQWLVEALGILSDPAESAALARSVPDTGGVVFVPALAGLSAPYWDARARGLVIGLSRATTRAQLVRAALEGIALSVRAVTAAMERDAGVPIRVLRVDGGPTENDFLMQFQADVLGAPIEVAEETEATARGAAILAGLALGLWELAVVATSWGVRRRYEPEMTDDERAAIVDRWERAVARCRAWATDPAGTV
ncbi:MAG: glycerol kinase GlpK [Thermomicrobium sp.]|nr:glycerol kinase GlpK [Thermomicrobium sp.]